MCGLQFYLQNDLSQTVPRNVRTIIYNQIKGVFDMTKKASRLPIDENKSRQVNSLN